MDIEKEWDEIDGGLYRIEIPLSDFVQSMLRSILDFTQRISSLDDVAPLASHASHVLGKSLADLLSNPNEMDAGYLEALNQFLSAYSDLLKTGNRGDHAEPITEIMRSVELFHNVHVGEINPTGISVLPETNKLGSYLIQMGLITEAQLMHALKLQDPTRCDGRRLGDILQEQKIITRAQLDEAIDLQMLDSMQ